MTAALDRDFNQWPSKGLGHHSVSDF